MVPVLLFLYPGESPATITSITLTVAFFNALSGSIAYGRLRRIDLRSGLLFSAASIPGAVIGSNITFMLSRGVFQTLFAVILLLVSVFLALRPQSRIAPSESPGRFARCIVDKSGTTYKYSYRLYQGLGISFFVGLLSGLLGIGGGIMHVPALTQILCFPTHVATATSHFVVATTTFSAVATHVVSGEYTQGLTRAAVLSAGAVIGAQFGARMSQRVPARLIIRLLALGLAMVAIRLLIAPA